MTTSELATSSAVSTHRTRTVNKITRIQAARELHDLETAAMALRWNHDPIAWATEKLGESLWSGQVEILQAVRDHRQTAVATAHEVGKSKSAGLLAAWWLDSHVPGEAFVVTTAPTQPQVEVILWKEIGRAHEKGRLFGRVNQTEWKRPPTTPDGRWESIAMGRKPNDYAPSTFTGIHARFVLVIVDEANGVRGGLWPQIDSLMANDNSKILEIGNPDDPSGEFYAHCKPGSGYHVIHLSAFDSPNFTTEPFPAVIKESLIGRRYVEAKRKKWAPTWFWVNTIGEMTDAAHGVKVVPPEDKTQAAANPYWYSKVLGEFPENAEGGGLIPLSWIKAAQLRTLQPTASLHELGVDVGGGGDATAVCHRRGPVFRMRRTDHDPNTMTQCGKIIVDIKETGATVAKVDKIGIGWGIVDRGKELNEPIVGINVSESATEPAPDADDASSDDRFLNKKAELWWGVRDLFESGNIDIEDDSTPYGEDLAAELCNVLYERLSSGKIKIKDKKKNAQGETISSPNLAEALMLAAAPMPKPKAAEWANW